LAEAHWLKTDEDITHLLQEAFPLVDDPAARDAIVAQFGSRARGRQRGPWVRAVQAAIAMTVLGPAVALGWIYGWPRMRRLITRFRGGSTRC
jgi:hypothetical protein